MSKTHGTRYAYNSGCRCDECRSANAAYMAQYRREVSTQNTHPAWRSNRRWEPWEDELASDYMKSAQQIADMLERTPSAVSNRRRYLATRRNKQK